MTAVELAQARLHVGVVRDGVADRVAVEEPLEIRVGGTTLAITMRTPGHDEELAIGFLAGEGLIGPGDDVAAGLTDDLAANTIEVGAVLRRDPGLRRFYTTSSCGVCGKGALAEVASIAPPPGAGPLLGRGRLGFAATGGLHATGRFSPAGELLCAREDVGRHNAMDKVVGRAFLDGELPLHDSVLCVSGRLSFELVQKAAAAGAPVLVGVGAPTSLAVAVAADRGITLAGFARRGRVNIYAGEERLRRPSAG
jgi:FdhD protein